MEETMQKNVEMFVKSMDFMRIGQAVNHGQWQSAFMALRRLMQLAKECDCMEEFGLPLKGLKEAVSQKNSEMAKQTLSILVAKRARIRNALTQTK